MSIYLVLYQLFSGESHAPSTVTASTTFGTYTIRNLTSSIHQVNPCARTDDTRPLAGLELARKAVGFLNLLGMPSRNLADRLASPKLNYLVNRKDGA